MTRSTRQSTSRNRRRRAYRTLKRRTSARNTRITGTFGLLAVIVLLLGWRIAPAHRAGRQAPAASRQAGALTRLPSTPATTSARSVGALRRRSTGHVSPTSVFAFSDRLILCLPYPKSAVTAIAYHQVYAEGSLRLTPAPQVAHVRMPTDVPRLLEVERESSIALKTVPQKKMFRSDRTGPPDRAVDVGAKLGTPVRAPVSGRIKQVRPYMLYGRYPDIEVDIIPDANPRVRVMMFHMNRVVAKKGRRVISGVTTLGRVRDLAAYFEPHLAEFSRERGNHVHIQIKPLNVE